MDNYWSRLFICAKDLCKQSLYKKTFAKTNRAHQSKPFNRGTDTIAYFWGNTDVLPW